ncbi:tetratricopeptide repeat protein [Scytonema hofmannii FACHB-248]|uniref:Tetratricopeptide repeat protein n=1 Tax=Scytonema hofmannii FACHB-248 TaxID=1842502 RepID=A0ABR8GV93_9CYAN|nr:MULTISPECIES: tetratricopeptide repeat protein [Nostocales]MBD2607058.1 tetratricopeptide repeat protein [Scytonema hofmannii FACHB-248]
MRINKFLLIVFSTLLLTGLQSVWLNPLTFGESAVVAQTPDARKTEADRLLQQGIEQYKTSQFEAAFKSWEQALIIYREIKDRQGEGQSLGNLGNAYSSLGNYVKAIDYLEQTLAILREIKDRKGEGAALGNLGNAYFFLGNYVKAIDYQQQSLAIAREIKDRNGEGNALGNLGVAYKSLGNYVKAIEYYQQGLAIARQIKDRLGEGASLGNLGNAYFLLGNYVKAIEYQEQSLAIARKIKDRNGEGESLGNLGLAYNFLGNYVKAIEYYEQYLAIAREIKDRNGEGKALGNLGIAYRALGNYAKAIEYYEQSLAIKREIKDRLGESQSLGNLGNAYFSLGNYAKAIDYLEQTLAIAREIKDLNGEGQSLNNLGLALYKSGKLAEAEKILRTGIERYESLRELLGNNDSYKVSIFEQQANIYRILQEVLIAQNKPSLALEISERGRSRAFVELLTSRLESKTTGQTPEPTVAKPTLSLLQQIAKEQNATFVEYSIVYNDFKIQGKQEAKESELYIWVIKPTGEVTFRKIDLKPLWQKENTNLAKLVSISRDSIGVRAGGIVVSENPNAAKPKNQLKRLHELLINPIADLLPKNPSDRVIFIPQDALFLVPFPALQDANGKYLIEKHTILTAPSIQVLDLTHQQRERGRGGDKEKGGILIVGNPTMPSVPPEPGEKPEQLASLPGAEKEARAIASLLNTKPIIGSQGTKASVVQKMPSARIIHLATHGIFDDNRGLGSAIALAPDASFSPKPGEINGLLTAEEILDLKLQAELVVLSACDTGRGKITGDGVIGLSRSLISAGVPSVLVSLWSVPDSPTAELMSQFYTNLQQRRMDKAQALRQAMLTTMKTHPSPRDWAAFTLIGESE